MGQQLSYLYESMWITEGSTWRPPEAVTLRDEAGVVIGSTQMATMLMTIYDLSSPDYPVLGSVLGVGGVQQVDVKNTRSCTLSSQGLFVLTLLPTDTVILVPTSTYELRRVLIEYTWPSTPTKADALELTIVIRNVLRRPYVAP